MAVGQVAINPQLRDHLEGLYASPMHTESHKVGDFLNEFAGPRLKEVQAEGLDEDIILEESQDVLRDMAHGKCPCPDGLPVEYL
ncbi:hypothetical protein NDU88_003326 [Pleurodeles waltl]|uniref:Uncharacterized protein n=1 Tax=Pleurodeles waltl TaxID=8319 RepID=A0AAV7QBF1_PLEWA|nr:hypothetical protein NDU88_003326 [Pleurodeles waltl]